MKTFYTTSIFALVLLITSSISMSTYGQVLAVKTTTNTDKVKRGSNHLQKAKHALEQEDIEAFWKYIKQARLKCPCKHKTYFMKGVAHVKQDKLDRAQTLFEMALEHATKKDANLDTILYSIAQVYAIAGEYDIAMDYINRTEGNIGGQGYYKRGLINMKSSNPDKAIGQFLEHIRQQMKLPLKDRVLIPEAKFNMALCHHALGNHRLAEQLYRESLELTEDLNIRLALIDLLFEQGRREEGVSELKVAVKKYMGDVDTRNYLTNILLNEISVSDAALNNMLVRNSTSDHTSLTQGNLALRKRNEQEAIEHYEKVSGPFAPLAQNGLATAYFNTGEVAKAEEIWGMILSIDPNNPIALEGMGIIEFLRGDYFSSKQYITQAEDADLSYKLSYDGLLCLGYISIIFEAYDEAIQLFTKGISKSKKNHWAYAGIGYCIYDQSAYKEAMAWFKKALKGDPANPVFRGYMGMSEFWMSYLRGGRLETKRYRKALGHLQYAFDAGISNAYIYNALALCYAELKQFDKAEQIIAEVRGISPENYRFWMNSGNIQSEIASEHERKGNEELMHIALENMMAFYDKALELGVPEDDYYVNVAYGYLKARQFRKSEEIYEMLPLNSSVRYNNLGALHALEGNRSRARMEFEKAIQLEMQSPSTFSHILKPIYDINHRKSNSTFASRNYFISVYNFYLPMEPATPEVNNETNLPVHRVQPEMPEDDFQALIYDDETFCEKQKKTKTVYIKQPKKKHFTTCG